VDIGKELDIRKELERFHPNPEWLDRYLRFIESPSPRVGQYHRHHRLPRSIFPEFESLEKYPSNRKDLSPADHLTAHYLLFRAFLSNPEVEPKVSTGFFWMIVTAMAVPNHDDVFIREIAARFQTACESGARFPWAERRRPLDFQCDADDILKVLGGEAVKPEDIKLSGV
jgi:hypothetical protein